MAITRAKASLIVVGDAQALDEDQRVWRPLIADLRRRESIFTADARKFKDFLDDWLAQAMVRKVVPVSGKYVGLALRDV